jgi:DNA polymerase III epsilon subunit family exonuclease
MIFGSPYESDEKLVDLTYAALDVETTGFSIKYDRICEIGIVRWKFGEKTTEFSTLINPERSISQESKRVHGITEVMVKDAPLFYEIADEVEDLLKDTIILGHNVFIVDLSFLNKELKNAGRKPIYNLFIDTHVISKRIFPGLRKRSLKSLAETLEIKVDEYHRALSDARVTMKIWMKILDKMRRDGVETIGDLQKMGILYGRVREKAKKVMEIARQQGFVKIVYQSPFSGNTVRIIEPLGVRGNKLDAYCHLREDFRTFELDRIIEIE